MNASEPPSALAMTCDANGVLVEVLLDDLGAVPATAHAPLFVNLFDRENAAKAISFLEEIRTEGVAFAWELLLATPGYPRVVLFAGMRVDRQILIVGAESPDTLADLWDWVVDTGSHQMPPVALPPIAETPRSRFVAEQGCIYAAFDEPTSLCSESMNFQRDLFKSNQDLATLSARLERCVEEQTAQLEAAHAMLEEEIARRVRAEVALRDSETRYRRLIESTQAIAFRFELEEKGRVTYVSPAIHEILGFLAGEFCSDPEVSLKVIHAEDLAVLQTLGLERPSETTQIVRCLRRDGLTVGLEIHLIAIRDENGRVVAYDGIAREITGPKRAGAESSRQRGGPPPG